MDSQFQEHHPWARVHSLEYPVRLDALGAVLDEIRSYSRSARAARPSSETSTIIGESPEMQVVRRLVEKVAPSTATVLINGESGTGKEVVARQIHELSGRKGPFVAINCGAIPDHLLESELFGHERGAFTGAVASRAGRLEMAEGGTFFLDEIGDMPQAMQVKLLRLLEDRTVVRVGGDKSIPVDVRLIAATHRDLPKRIEDGRFREDLFYRLSVFPIDISPLRDRPADVAPLIEEFIHRMRGENSPRLQITDAAMKRLEAYSWPGNVRELANLIERLIVIPPNGVVDEDDLPWPFVDSDRQERQSPEVVQSDIVPVPAKSCVTLPPEGIDLKKHLATIERELIENALAESDGVVQRAADMLGIGRTTLVEKIRRFDPER